MLIAMSTTECHIEFDGRLWDVQRLLKAGDQERARVESALLVADSEAAGHDWVGEELQRVWQTKTSVRATA